jgi:hypothetical protein
MKDLIKQKIKNTKIEKGIDYFGSVEAISINGEIYNVGTRALALSKLEESGWKNKINFQDGLKYSGLLDGSVSINKNEVLFVIGRNGGVYYLEQDKWNTAYEPDDLLVKKWLFIGNYDAKNDRMVINGGYSGTPKKYSPNNTQTFIFKENKWTKISNNILKQECNENMELIKSKPYEHLPRISIEQCYDFNLNKIILLGEKYSYILTGNKWVHHETKGLKENISLDQRKIFHIKELKKTFILNEDGILYEYALDCLTPYAKIDLTDLDFQFYNCSCHYNDKKELLYLFGKDGKGWTIKIITN